MSYATDAVLERGSGLDTLSAIERHIIDKVEEALTNGQKLERWYRQQEPVLTFFPLDLERNYRMQNRAEGFFSRWDFNGNDFSVMGCRQEVNLGYLRGPNAPARLQEFVLRDFLSKAHWTNPDGAQGGFTVQQVLYKTEDGEYGKMPQELRSGCVDWREIGKKYSWVLMHIGIHDFVMEMGPFRKHLWETVWVPASNRILRIIQDPSPDRTLEVTIGYPFTEYTERKSVFGFGPGKFGIAFKRFSFSLTRDNQVRMQMAFVVSPRCEKVLDLWRGWDPIYGGATVLETVTFGRWSPQRFHDRLDGKILMIHCQVHQALMEGLPGIWPDLEPEVR